MIEAREMAGDAVTLATDTEGAHRQEATVVDRASEEAHAVIRKTLREGKVAVSCATREGTSEHCALSAVTASEESRVENATLQSNAETPECTTGADVTKVATRADSSIRAVGRRPIATDAHRETTAAPPPAETTEALAIAARRAAPQVMTAEALPTTPSTCEARVV